MQKLTRVEMVERQLKGICYNCDDKYFLGHKYKEQKLFMAVTKDLYEEDIVVWPSDPPDVDPMISLNAPTGFSALHTLKLIGYIKNRKVIILVDSGSTHNFIHCRISHEVNCYICVVNKFQIMIANDGSMKCGG
jgi:hypothetical protein